MKRTAVHLVLAAAAWAVAASAQMSGFDASLVKKYTPLNPYPRLDDGRPAVPDLWLYRLQIASTSDAWNVLAERGYHYQFEDGWKNTRPERKLIGRAFTARFLPARSDVDEVIGHEAQAAGLDAHPTKRIIDMLRPGDVLVVDVMGRIEFGQFGGDNLIYGLFMKTGNGFVVDGSFRDLDGVAIHNMPVYARGHHPGVRGGAMLTALNVPVRIGGATVMPGDVVLGDRTGIIFVPPHLVEAVVGHAEKGRWPTE